MESVMKWFAKKVVDRGGGNDLKNQVKSYGCLSEFLKNLKYFYKKLSNFLTSRREEELSKGSILIEFAICMPILIILLFYINDLVRIKRYYSQTEFVAQQFVNIIQNISQKRSASDSTKLKISVPDIKYAASLAFLSMYPGKTMYRIGTSGSRHELSHSPRLNIFYVKGLPGGKASCKWNMRLASDPASDPVSWNRAVNSVDPSHSSVNMPADATTPSDIYPTLKIGENDEKIIVEVNLFNAISTMNENNYVETDKQATLAKKAFNCRLVTPKPLKTGVTQGWYFSSVVIFTPKPGLFDPDNPPDWT